MSASHTCFYGYYLYYDDDTLSDLKDAFNYLGKLDESQIKTFFTAAKIDGEANFKSSYGYDYKIIYSDKMYTLVKR